MPSAWQAGTVWKARRTRYFCYCPGFYWQKSQTCWQIIKNKEAMKESHYEPETKISPGCAFRDPTRTGYWMTQRPSYQRLTVTVVKIIILLVKAKTRAWNFQGFKHIIMKDWYQGKQSNSLPSFLATGGICLHEKNICVHRVSRGMKKNKQPQPIYQLRPKLDGLSPCTSCVSWS